MNNLKKSHQYHIYQLIWIFWMLCWNQCTLNILCHLEMKLMEQRLIYFSIFLSFDSSSYFSFTFRQEFDIRKISLFYFLHNRIGQMRYHHSFATPLVPYQLCGAAHSEISSARKCRFSIQSRGFLENQAPVSEMVWWKTEGNLTCLPWHGVCPLKLSKG